MDATQLNFKGSNPGAVQYGNFINYYQFNPPENRIKLLPLDLWNPNKRFYGLDLGCNAGDLTISLYNFLKDKVKSCEILGVDIDPSLVERASEKIQTTEDISFAHINFMEESGKTVINDYMKKRKIKKFDAVFCFSITMWIHLNHGDDGLKNFLSEICTLGDIVVIEPQLWKCYKQAVKRLKSSNFDFPLFNELHIRQNVEETIIQFLSQHCKASKLYESSRTVWGRKVLIFKCNI